MMYTAQTDQRCYKVCCPSLPLAVYREVAAHLRQVYGVATTVLPASGSTFDYAQSQVGGLSIEFLAESNRQSRQRVDQILAYYGDRYGGWQVIHS